MFVDRNVSWCIIWSMVSVNMHNAHPASACAIRCMKMMRAYYIYTVHISSFVRDIFQDAGAKLYNTELAISKLYGHVWTTWFSRFFSHWNSLPSWTELAQEPSNWLILCWGYFTWKQYLGNTFLTCLYPWEAPFQMHVLFVLVWGFEFEGLLQLRMPQKDAEVMWNCSLSSFPQVSTQSMNATVLTVPWKLMASSGLWPWGSRRACLWEIELPPNQHC